MKIDKHIRPHRGSNGYLERSHKTLKTYLRSFVDKDNSWDNLLCYAMFTYNTSVHTSIGFTPYDLIFGKKSNIFTEFLKEPEPEYNNENYATDRKRIMQKSQKVARNNLIDKKNVNKNNYGKTMNPITIHVGQKVLIKVQNKRNTLSRNRTGSFEVTHVHEN